MHCRYQCFKPIQIQGFSCWFLLSQAVNTYELFFWFSLDFFVCIVFAVAALEADAPDTARHEISDASSTHFRAISPLYADKYHLCASALHG